MNVPYVPGQNEDMTVEFQHLGIQCVRRRDVADALKQREQIRVDPFRQGFDHMNSPQAVDLNAVRLCFQVCTIFCKTINPVIYFLLDLVCLNFVGRFSWRILTVLASTQSHSPLYAQNLYLMQRPRKRFRYAQNLYVMLQVCSKPIYDAMAKKKLQVQKHLHFEVPKCYPLSDHGYFRDVCPC